MPMNPPPGFVALTLAKGCVFVIPERVYVASLRLGKTLRRREAMEQRTDGRSPMRTFRSEAWRLIQQHGMDASAVIGSGIRWRGSSLRPGTSRSAIAAATGGRGDCGRFVGGGMDPALAEPASCDRA